MYKMVELMFTTEAILCLLLPLMLFYVAIKIKAKKHLQLPGPQGIPLFGNFFQLDTQNIHLTLDKWGYQYGDMFCFNIMGNNILVINTSEIARELFLKEPMATLTASRMPCFFSKYIVNEGDIAFCPYNDEWKYRRKIGNQLLGAYGEGLQEIENHLTTIMEEVVRKMKECQNKVVDPIEYVNSFLLENIELMVSGGRGNKDLQKYIVEWDDTANSLLNPGVDSVLFTCPFIKHIPGYFSNLVNRLSEARNATMNTLKNIHEHNPNLPGMYQKLLDIVKADEKKENRKITCPNVKHILQNMIGAGYLTTHGSLMSILKILICKPQIQTKIQEEIAKVIGIGRLPLIRDRQNCHYTEAVILESLRYISHVPIIFRYTNDEFEVRGTQIPKNCTIFLNTWHIHHNEKEFEEPFEFKPERFLDDDGKLLLATDPKRKRLLTFGVGKRSCFGEVLARSRIFLFLAHVMQHFSVEPSSKEEVRLFHPTEMKPGLILHPTYYTCKFIPK